jgi:1-acyl-sn-glycerol-3-phosphate acyltransferase
MTTDTAKPNRNLEAAYRLDADDQTTTIRFIALLARVGMRLFANVRVEGLDRIPKTGAVIIAANHQSNLDGVVTGGWITEALRRRRIHWLGKREMFTWPIAGRLAANGGVHPVDRGASDVEAFRLATRILEAGHLLLVFPEGTRSPDGALQEAKDGVALLALRTGAQIVPVGLNNTDGVWKKGRPIPLPIPRHTVTMRVGEPFRLGDILPSDADRRTAKTLATKAIMGRIAELLDPRHRGVYADAVRDAARAR